jgi:hypothetical protein
LRSFLRASTSFHLFSLFLLSFLSFFLCLPFISFLSLSSGDFTKWMIATWGSIYNGGAGYTGGTRPVEKSSLSQTPCEYIVVVVVIIVAAVISLAACVILGFNHEFEHLSRRSCLVVELEYGPGPLLANVIHHTNLISTPITLLCISVKYSRGWTACTCLGIMLYCPLLIPIS